MNELADVELLARVAGGRRPERDAAFRELVERHRDRVHGLCLRYFGDRSDAEDAAQEAFLRVLRHAGTFRGEAQVSTWLHRLTVNTCHDLARRRARRPQTAVADIAAVSDAVDPVPDPTAGLPLAAALRDALGQLDPETRELLLLCTVEGMPYAEVAAEYEIAVGTVKSRVHRARARLVEILGDALDDDDAVRPAAAPAERRPGGPSTGVHGARGPPG